MSDTSSDSVDEQLLSAADDLAGILASPYGSSAYLIEAKKHLTEALRSRGQDPESAFDIPHMQKYSPARVDAELGYILQALHTAMSSQPGPALDQIRAAHHAVLQAARERGVEGDPTNPAFMTRQEEKAMYREMQDDASREGA